MTYAQLIQLIRVMCFAGVIQTTDKDEFSYQEMITHLPLCALKVGCSTWYKSCQLKSVFMFEPLTSKTYYEPPIASPFRVFRLPTTLLLYFLIVYWISYIPLEWWDDSTKSWDSSRRSLELALQRTTAILHGYPSRLQPMPCRMTQRRFSLLEAGTVVWIEKLQDTLV